MNQSYFVGANAKKSSEGVSLPAISKIILIVDEENAFEAGNDTGYALEVYCPYGTQRMAYDLLAQARGFVYTGYSAKSVQLPPEAELGDGVRIGSTYGMLASRKFSFTPKLTEDIEAPLEKEVEHEYSYEGTLTKEVKRKLTLGASYYGTSITRTHGLEIKHYDASGNPTTRVTLNSETLAFYNADGNKAFYYDSTSGEFKISSSIVVGLDEYEKKAELSTDISTYIDTAAGTAKIVSACSATYLSKTSAAAQYETITAAAQIAQSVSDVQSEISLSASYGSGTIGSNVRALIQLVSNADTSSIEIKASKINFSGVTTFLRPGDNISKLANNAGYQTSANVTKIIGNTVTTGYIEALNISVGAAQITGKLTASQINANNITATGVTLTGNITATSGKISNLTIDGRLYFGGNRAYFIDANKNDSNYYISLPGIKVDDATGINCTKGKIGGFTLASTSMYTNGHSSLYDTSYAGIYIGTDGISLLGSGGAKKMVLDIANASFTFNGTINATAGSIGAWTINSSFIGTSQSGGSFYIASASDSSDYWIRAHNASSGGGTRTFAVSKSGYLSATGASISGAITATSGTIGNQQYAFTISSSGSYADIHCGITALPGTGGVGAVSNQVYIGTNGLGYKVNTTDSAFDYTTVIRSGTVMTYGDVNGSGNYNRCVCMMSNEIFFCNAGTTKVGSTHIRNYEIASMEIPNGANYVYMSGAWKSQYPISVISDRNKKYSIEDLDERYLALFDRLTPQRFKYRQDDDGRFHTGFIAQDVREAAISSRLTNEELAAVCADGVGSPDELWSLKYDEFIAILVAKIKSLESKIQQLGGY